MPSSWVLVGPSGKNKCSQVIVSAICSKEKISNTENFFIRFQKVVLFSNWRWVHKNYACPLMIKWRFVSGLISKLVTTEGLGKVWCLIWVEFGSGWGFNPMNLTSTSTFFSSVVWVNLFTSRLQVTFKYSRVSFILLIGKIRLLRLWLAWSNYWISSASG